jgi:indole-3-glycerol phosphate synthase
MILDRIVEAKKVEVAQAKRQRPLSALEREIARMDAPRPFASALRREDRIALIAEIKKASPSAGVIRVDFDHVDIAQIYDDSPDVSGISVLTDEKFFQGHLDFIGDVRRVSEKPVLRKDFLFDEYQVIEARAFGADAILLIVAILQDNQLARLLRLAEGLAMAALVETHDADEVKRALDAGATLIGVNNRDLRDFSVDLNTSLRLRKLVPPETTFVSESGIHTRDDVRVLEAAGVNAILVGESLMRSDDMRRKIDELLGLR